MYNTELRHYGVKGMRWGVRNNSLVSSTKRKPPRNAKVDGPPEIKTPKGAVELKSKYSARGKKIVGAIIGGTALAGIGMAAIRGAKYSKVINAGKDLIKNLDTSISILNNR